MARAAVCRLQADAIQYRVALAFDQPLDVRARVYTAPAVLAAFPDAPDQADTDRSTQGDIVFAERLTA